MRPSLLDNILVPLIIVTSFAAVSFTANRIRAWLLRRMLSNSPVLREAIKNEDLQSEFENFRSSTPESIAIQLVTAVSLLLTLLLAIHFRIPSRIAYASVLFWIPIQQLSYAWFMRKRLWRNAIHLARSRGFKVCAGCGYDLRNINSARCPECGVESSA